MSLRPIALLLFALGLGHALAKDSASTAAPGAAVFEEVAAFELPPHYPMARLLYVTAADAYYGTTPDGGKHGGGTVFRLSPDGTSITLFSFSGDNGSAPLAALVPGADGALYGTASDGGTSGFGTIFKITTGGTFTKLVDFTGASGAAKGAVPGDLVLAPDGNFYGTTQAGGASDCGTIFRLTPAGAFNTVVEFTGTSGARKGAAPIGALVASGPTLYGVTQAGGAGGGSGLTDLGTVFKVTTAGAFTTLVEFSGVSAVGTAKAGSAPAAGLCLHSDGLLYGTTEFGGTNDLGTVFKITTSGSHTLLRNCDDATGAQPAGALVQASDGALYGTMNSGGAAGFGTVFKITQSGSHTLLASFTGATGAKLGANPRAGLTALVGGAFAGTTSAGGIGGFGTCFTITTAASFANLLSFSTADGWNPAGGPAFDAAGDVFVPLEQGGASGFGTLARVAAGGAAVLAETFGAPLGETPAGGLAPLGGSFYGVTSAGGATARGTFFKHTPGSGTTLLASGTTSSASTFDGPPTLGADGLFYVVARGRSSGKGAILRYDANGAGSTLVSFTGTSGAAKGTRPLGPLALGGDGSFYGVTELGGANDRGTVFKVTPAGVLTTLVEFSASPQPNSPRGGLVLGADGNFYGTTAAGGASGHGTLFRLSPAGALTVLVNFTDTGGAWPGSEPEGSLLAAPDGALYGATTHGGSEGEGTIFRISPAGAHTVLFDFTGSHGSTPGEHPGGAIVFGPDGCIHGTARSGGTKGGGNVFRLRKCGPHAGTGAPTFAPGAITLRGHAQTGGDSTSVSFEYGPTPALGLSTAPASLGIVPADFSAVVTGITPGATLYFRAVAANASGSSTGIVQSAVVPDPLTAWKLATFGDAGVSLTDDCDGDGVTNLAEYALLTCPTAQDATSRPQPVVTTYPEGARLALTLERDPARDDVTIEVQGASSPGGPWSVVAKSTLGAPFTGPGVVSGDSASPGIKTVEIRDVVNLGDVPARFLRVHVTH